MIAQYGHLSARSALIDPYAPAHVSDLAESGHSLDQVWRGRLAALGIEPVSSAPQHLLLRRLALDLTGRPPTPDEVREFERMDGAVRMSRFAARYLESEEFTELLAEHLWEWFEVPFPKDDLRHTRDGNISLRMALRAFASTEEPLTSLLDAALAGGSPDLFRRHRDPRDRAEFAGRTFLGIRIGCARCHNHPMDRWTQAQHLQFSALFTDPVRPKRADGSEIAAASGEFFLPGDGKPVEPRILPMGKLQNLTVSNQGSRTKVLRRFLLEGNREQMARNVANRIFGILLGRPLVDRVDDHRLSNPSLHEPVLEALTERVLFHDFRLRPVFRWIVTSDLYALSSGPPSEEILTGDPAWLYMGRREARALSSRHFLRSVESVLGVPLTYEAVPPTPLAAQLQLLNSGALQKAIRTPGSQLEAIFEFETDPDVQLEQLFLLILSRRPSEPERKEFLRFFGEAGTVDEAKAAGRDLAFALFAGREFGSIR